VFKAPSNSNQPTTYILMTFQACNAVHSALSSMFCSFVAIV